MGFLSTLLSAAAHRGLRAERALRRPSVMRLAALTLLAGIVLTACGRGEARDCPGQTEVQPPNPPDERLARDVRDKLFRNPLLPDAPSIVVTVDGGRVLLQGWVSSVNARTLAEADALTVAGVVSVDDRLLIRHP
jgi:hypothetical protein